jgi:hypothetical protein
VHLYLVLRGTASECDAFFCFICVITRCGLVGAIDEGSFSTLIRYQYINLKMP